MIIVADVAGEFKTLQALLQKCDPTGTEPVVLVGDIIDRGPQSREVIEWAMANEPRVTSLMGNHEHMMVTSLRNGTAFKFGSLWLQNGGTRTASQFMTPDGVKVPEEILAWLETRPLFFQAKGLLVTHAPIPEQFPSLGIEHIARSHPELLLWNRGHPAHRLGVFQVFGHNSHVGLRFYSEDGIDYAVCLDTCRDDILTALLWPSRLVVQQPFIE